MTMRPSSLIRAVELQILLALAESPKHGYAIKRDVESRSQGALHLGPGTLYEAMRRLRLAALIEDSDDVSSSADESEGGRGAPRRTYRLTRSGRVALERELERLASLLDHARSLHLVPSRR